jgi:hypothetical protein
MSGDVQHGTRHNPRGTDSVRCDVFRIVGDDEGATALINGFTSAPTAQVPNPTPLQYRLSIGPPNVCDYTGWAPADPTTPTNPLTDPRPMATAIIEYTDHQIEIQGDLDGVVPGDLIFILPMEYRKETDLPYKGHDNFGNYVPCRLLSTGEFYYGVP